MEQKETTKRPPRQYTTFPLIGPKRSHRLLVLAICKPHTPHRDYGACSLYLELHKSARNILRKETNTTLKQALKNPIALLSQLLATRRMSLYMNIRTSSNEPVAEL